MNLTDNQIIHRAYLRSPLWQQKRAEALAHHGCICSRCGGHGSDVHHKTYERTGGNELMSDLEVMCRGCHEAHHRIERAIKPRAKKQRDSGGISRQALAGYLTPKQREILQARFCLSWGQLYSAILDGRNAMIRAALEMTGRKYAYVTRGRPNARDSHWKSKKHYAKLMG